MKNGNGITFEEVPGAAPPAAAALGVKGFKAESTKGRPKPSKPPVVHWRDNIISAALLRTKVFEPIRFIVPGLIAEGLSMLVGRPKIGKSWMALEIAATIAGKSGTCLGLADAELQRGDVLYCALEDNPRRLQARLTKLLGANKQEWPTRLQLTTQWQRLDQGGVIHIAEWMQSVMQPRLVILDTLASVRPVRERDGYAQDYAALAELHRLANDTGLAILVLHHQRKAEAEDPLDSISGTLGLAGCVDTPLILQGSPAGMTLYVRGRDVEEAEHAIAFDKETARWTIRGAAADVHRSETRSKILAVLRKVKPRTMSPGELAGQTELAEHTVRQALGRMVGDGEVLKASRGEYAASL